MEGIYGTCSLSSVRRFLIFLLFFFLFTSTVVVVSLPEDSSAIISRFQQYLRINTAHPNPDYSPAADFILSQAKTIGLESQFLEFVKSKPVILLKWSGTNPDLPSIILNSHMDVVAVENNKWTYPPLDAHIDEAGNIYARGSQDMKCVGMQYLEAIRRLKNSGFQPVRTVYVSFVPDKEIGGHDGAEKLAESEEFQKMNVGILLDEGLASTNETYRAFFAERSPWWLVIKATGSPGHGSKLYDNSAMENLMKSIESVTRFRAAQFDMLKAGLKEAGEIISVNMVFLKAGTPSPTGFVMNMQPSEAEAGFDIRIPPTVDEKLVEKRIEEEWAPSSRNMTFEFIRKVPVLPVTDGFKPWLALLEGAVKKANGKLGRPEVLPLSSDSPYYRQRGLPAIGFSPMTNTPILLHDHNEIYRGNSIKHRNEFIMFSFRSKICIYKYNNVKAPNGVAVTYFVLVTCLFLNQVEYLKGIEIYESIIEAYTSYTEHTWNAASTDEL
ncbi:aminoacylase-1-like [Telopea speciosissima]|uniref:aminoacylase-1-like n=1 Tax=Telopea speciosissima TaxID=54955 RepID=UPI001CC80F82|nr:aminoacylase-1-like [Telopea speciosissima]